MISVMDDPLNIESIQSALIEVRGQQVLIDSDVARIYGVQTRDVNKAVRNNLSKFPEDYIFEITNSEKLELVENFHRFRKLKHSTVNPKAFPEKGLYMLATILKSPRATQATFAIIETFSTIRELSKSLGALQAAEDGKEKKSLMRKSGQLFSEMISDTLQPSESESTLEVNLAVLKLKHSVKRAK